MIGLHPPPFFYAFFPRVFFFLATSFYTCPLRMSAPFLPFFPYFFFSFPLSNWVDLPKKPVLCTVQHSFKRHSSPHSLWLSPPSLSIFISFFSIGPLLAEYVQVSWLQNPPPPNPLLLPLVSPCPSSPLSQQGSENGGNFHENGFKIRRNPPPPPPLSFSFPMAFPLFLPISSVLSDSF